MLRYALLFACTAARGGMSPPSSLRIALRTGVASDGRSTCELRGQPLSAEVTSASVAGTAVSGRLDWRPLPSPVSSGRSRTGGRPWSYYVRPVPPSRPRVASFRQALLIRLWKLDQPAECLFFFYSTINGSTHPARRRTDTRSAPRDSPGGAPTNGRVTRTVTPNTTTHPTLIPRTIPSVAQ